MLKSDRSLINQAKYGIRRLTGNGEKPEMLKKIVAGLSAVGLIQTGALIGGLFCRMLYSERVNG